MSHEPPISIRYEQSLAYAGSGGWHEGRTVFIQLFDSMVSSGLLAELTGNAFKVLSVLGLAASPLGLGSERDVAFFRDLVAASIVSPQDQGKLFCCVLHDELVRRTGISKNTLSRCTAELENRKMVEKRQVRKADGTRYNIFFILPASHLDKYHTNRPRAQCAVEPVPEIGTVPRTGANLRSTTTTTAPASAGAGFDREAVLAYFAKRKGITRYRPTAHDKRKLALLQEGGYSQEDVLAAIDQAFEALAPDAPPIRMFSYCATIALATPPRRLSPSESGGCSTGKSNGDTVSPSPATISEEPDSPSVLRHVISMYESEIGTVTPLVEGELRTLIAAYPDPSAWDTAFREAVRANVRRLSYVHQVLKRRATGASPNLPPSGGNDVKHESKSGQSQRGRDGNGGHRRRSRPARRVRPAADEELLAAQQRAAAMEPLDLVTVLGKADA